MSRIQTNIKPRQERKKKGAKYAGGRVVTKSKQAKTPRKYPMKNNNQGTCPRINKHWFHGHIGSDIKCRGKQLAAMAAGIWKKENTGDITDDFIANVYYTTFWSALYAEFNLTEDDVPRPTFTAADEIVEPDSEAEDNQG